MPPSKVRTFLKPNRKVSFEELLKTYDRSATITEVKATHKLASEILDTPLDNFYIDEVVRNSDKLMNKISEKYDVKSNVRKRISYLMGMITRSRKLLGIPIDGSGCAFSDMYIRMKREERENPPEPPKNVPNWTKEVLPYLKEEAKHCPKKTGRIIAEVFSNGYVFRPSQLFTTKVVDDGKSNYLDLENGLYHIRDQKNRAEQVVQLPMDMINKIKPNAGKEWLLEKGGSAKQQNFSSNPSKALSKHDLGSRWGARDMRRSFDTWLHKESGYSDSRLDQLDRIIGHTTDVALSYYVGQDEEDED